MTWYLKGSAPAATLANVANMAEQSKVKRAVFEVCIASRIPDYVLGLYI